VSGMVFRVDESPLAQRLGSGAALEAALADIDARIGLAERASRPVDGPAADARLRGALEEWRSRSAPASGVALFFIVIGNLLGALAARIYDLLGRPSPAVVLPAQIVLGLALAAVIVAILLRGARERLRAEAALPAAGRATGPDPAARLREAEAALGRGDGRAAVRAYYLFALEALAAREAFAYDPALTDRELLTRAAAVPHADALRELVGLHERAWYGLRAPDAHESARARSLAERVGA